MTGRIRGIIRDFLDSGSSGGVVLIGSAALALIVANSPLAGAYFHILHLQIGPLSLLHWVNDALMAVFFLMVGLEIKREMADGHLSSWPRRLLPGVAAAAGMAVPALVYLWFNGGSPAAQGWAIPAATDIAFALGVMSLLGPRIPVSLKVFLAALAIIDDLGAVLVIGLFYAAEISPGDLGFAGLVVAGLVGLNLAGVKRLSPYLLLGVVLWVFTYRSGVHATIAGVLLALTVPLKRTPAAPEAGPGESPLHRLEHALMRPVAFLVVPVFGFANAGVDFRGFGPDVLSGGVTLGVAGGLVLGKLVGIFGTVVLLVRLGWASLPLGATWLQMFGTALLCGIGFTMSLFILLLAFPDPLLQAEGKLGVLLGSGIAGISGYGVLYFAAAKKSRRVPGPPAPAPERS